MNRVLVINDSQNNLNLFESLFFVHFFVNKMFLSLLCLQIFIRYANELWLSMTDIRIFQMFNLDLSWFIYV